MSVITKEAVFEAADALVVAGKSPKVATVREWLGKGSYTTINEYMRAWREGQKAPEPPTKEAAPKAVVDLAESMWTAALGMAIETLQSERQALEQQRIEMEEEQREAVAFADSLVSEVEQLREKVEALDGLLEVERSAHQETRNSLKSTYDEMIQYRADYNAAMERVSDFKSSSARYEQLYYKSEDENKKHLKRVSEQETLIARLEAKIENVEADMKHQVEVLVHELENERGKLAKAEKASEADRAAAQASQIEVATLKGKVESLGIQIEQQTKIIEAAADGSKGKAALRKGGKTNEDVGAEGTE